MYFRKWRQTGQSHRSASSTENTGATQDHPLPEATNRPQEPDTDPVTYYNMASDEEHPYHTVPDKEYDKVRYPSPDTDFNTNYSTLA